MTLHLETADLRPPLRGWLPRQLADLARRAGVAAGRIAVAAVDDARMSRLHLEHGGTPGTTDVLTFDLRATPGAPMALLEADLVICLDQAKREAATRGHAARLEVLLYALHGVLHLLGYDDHSPRQAAAMHRREDQILTEAGFGPLYSRPVAGRGPSSRRARGFPHSGRARRSDRCGS